MLCYEWHVKMINQIFIAVLEVCLPRLRTERWNTVTASVFDIAPKHRGTFDAGLTSGDCSQFLPPPFLNPNGESFNCSRWLVKVLLEKRQTIVCKCQKNSLRKCPVPFIATILSWSYYQCYNRCTMTLARGVVLHSCNQSCPIWILKTFSVILVVGGGRADKVLTSGHRSSGFKPSHGRSSSPLGSPLPEKAKVKYEKDLPCGFTWLICSFLLATYEKFWMDDNVFHASRNNSSLDWFNDQSCPKAGGHSRCNRTTRRYMTPFWDLRSCQFWPINSWHVVGRKFHAIITLKYLSHTQFQSLFSQASLKNSDFHPHLALGFIDIDHRNPFGCFTELPIYGRISARSQYPIILVFCIAWHKWLT